jgi:hypothetical protein
VRRFIAARIPTVEPAKAPRNFVAARSYQAMNCSTTSALPYWTVGATPNGRRGWREPGSVLRHDPLDAAEAADRVDAEHLGRVERHDLD